MHIVAETLNAKTPARVRYNNARAEAHHARRRAEAARAEEAEAEARAEEARREAEERAERERKKAQREAEKLREKAEEEARDIRRNAEDVMDVTVKRFAFRSQGVLIARVWSRIACVSFAHSRTPRYIFP